MFMDAAKKDKLERMEKCVEEIRRRFGKDSIRNGVLCQNLRLPPEKAEITMPTGMQIEQLITEFAPTMLLVEHDSVFRDTVASKIVNI